MLDILFLLHIGKDWFLESKLSVVVPQVLEFLSVTIVVFKEYIHKFLWLGVPQQTALTPEINPFQYAIEINCLTLKDQTSYLISDSWSRSPLIFPNSSWIDRLLPQQQVNNTSILYIVGAGSRSYRKSCYIRTGKSKKNSTWAAEKRELNHCT